MRTVISKCGIILFFVHSAKFLQSGKDHAFVPCKNGFALDTVCEDKNRYNDDMVRGLGCSSSPGHGLRFVAAYDAEACVEGTVPWEESESEGAVGAFGVVVK